MKKIRHRRNSHLCVLCQEEKTWDWDYICRICRYDWAAGVRYRESESTRPEGTVEASIAWYWHLYHFAGDDTREWDAKQVFRDAALSLAGTHQVHRGGNTAAWAIGLPKTYRGTQPSSRYIVHGGEKSTEALQALYEAACDLMASAYKDGLREGRSFIRKLADGALSTRDLETYLVREKGLLEEED